ncbi:MAG: hypothetical protein PVF73_13110 [Bacteroidales bacterium]|jgi:hypothetical protein
MATKKELIDLLIKKPGEFTNSELDELLGKEDLTYGDLRPMLLRIFDMNTGTIKNKSEADAGMLGWLNKHSRKKREKGFWERIRRGDYSKIILAEGDSWFEYPLFITDIIDHLNRSRKKYAINSLAYGGDWIANILYEQEYIEKLSLLSPDVFLISGGGNDIVGGYRMAQLIHRRKEVPAIIEADLDSNEGKIKFAGICLNKDFFALMKLFKLQYKLLFTSIEKETEKFKNLKVITQGYDYAIPSSKIGFGIARPLINKLTGNGEWLQTPLLLRGYLNQKEQAAVVYGMIHYFNEMLIEVGGNYKNVYHIDSRGAVTGKGWYDELHPRSVEFRRIASVYEKCIESTDTQKKIYRVCDE